MHIVTASVDPTRQIYRENVRSILNMLGQILLALCTGQALILSIQSASVNHINHPMVTTPLGKIQGSILTSALGKPIYSFRGIRYAKAPIDELRFQPPVAVEKWTDSYDATEDGPMCPQPENSIMSEDCLNLSVYTTKLPEGENSPKRPVMVYFHAGGYYSGTSESIWAGPQYLLDQDIVLVMVNYRLATLGFLSTGDKLAPGNNGLKDQVMAMRWAKDNVASFRGDPDLVTIYGNSAGGSSVTLHLVSPMSKGLFHRAIAMSGSSFGNWPVPAHQFELAQKQARLVGCPDDTSANIFKCLKTKSSKEIGDTSYDFTEYGNDPILVWLPVVEPDFGQERFLTEDPVKLVQQGKFANVPFLTGVTTDEFAGSASRVVRNATLLKEMDEDFEEVAPIAFIYERDTDNSKVISKELRKFYLGNGTLDNSSLPGIAKLYADGVIGFGVNRAAKLMAENSKESVYYYRFNYKGRYSFFYLPGTDHVPYGVVHGDDLIYTFCDTTSYPMFNETDIDYPMVRKLTTLLANFARTGNPTPEPTDELDNTTWLPFSVKNNKYLDMGAKLAMKDNLYQDRYAQWEKLFPLPETSK